MKHLAKMHFKMILLLRFLLHDILKNYGEPIKFWNLIEEKHNLKHNIHNNNTRTIILFIPQIL